MNHVFAFIWLNIWNHAFAFILLNIWLIVMVYSWLSNRKGELDKQNYHTWRRMLWGQSEEQFLHQHRIVHRLGLPFAIGFYLLGMLGVLGLI